MRAAAPLALRLALIAAALALWQVLPAYRIVPPLFLPVLSNVVVALYQNWAEFAAALGVTLGEVALGIVIACGLGVVTGAALGAVPTLGRILLPLALALYSVPLVVLYPALTAWVGLGPQSKVVFASLIGFFPTLLAMAAGVKTIDPQYLLVARSNGASLGQQLRYVLLPATVPVVLGAVRIGGALVIIGTIVAEMLTSTAGLGFLITRYRTVLDSEDVFAAILIVVALTGLFDVLLRVAERRFAAREGAEPHEPQAYRPI